MRAPAMPCPGLCWSPACGQLLGRVAGRLALVPSDAALGHAGHAPLSDTTHVLLQKLTMPAHSTVSCSWRHQFQSLPALQVRLDSEGRRVGLGEYIPPRRWGFTLRRPREVRP